MLEGRGRLTLLAVLLILGYAALSLAAERDDASAGDAAQPPQPDRRYRQPFVGKLNGFSFYDVGRAGITAAQGCPATARSELKPVDLPATGLDFEARYLPEGTFLESESGLRCPDAVLLIAKNYELPNRVLLTVALVQAPRSLPATAPRVQLRPVFLAGRRGVLNRSLPPARSGELYLEDGEGTEGYYYVNGMEISESELLKIGRGIVKR